MQSNTDPAPAKDKGAPVKATTSGSASGVVKPARQPPKKEAVVIHDKAPAKKAAPPQKEAVKSTPVTKITPSTPKPGDQEGKTAVSASIGQPPKEPAAPHVGVSAHWIFLLGLGLLATFVWYFSTESARRKRIIGSFLAVAMTAMSVWFYGTLGMEKGIELQGGVSMEIKIVPVEGREITKDSQQQVIAVLEKRLNSLGTSEVILAPSGKDGIFLQIPGVGKEKLKEIRKTLAKVAKLEFSILHPQSDQLATAVANGAEVVPGYVSLPYLPKTDAEKELPVNQRRHALVKIKRDMSGKYVKDAHYFYGKDGHSISVKFTGPGADIMGPLTIENVGRPLAIIMDDEIISSPNIREPFSSGCQITGGFSQKEALALASALENPLENPIKIAYSNYISPTMGHATVQQGILAGIAGLALTLLFIAIYYRFAGLLALIGLLINMVMIFGAMALFRFTLTLPGIAGIILTIGVGIDANVLIYERLREEMALGKSLKSAIKTAYEKALSAIIDANITTLITAIILYSLAAGTVKGFAITLIIGILATLFTALLVTRVCFGWALESGFLKKLVFRNMIPDKPIDFLGKRKICIWASAIAVVASLVIVPEKDPRGVELKGGDSLTIHSSVEITKDQIEDSLSDLDLEASPIIQVQHPVGNEGEFFLIRSPDGTAPKIQAELARDLPGINLKDATVSSVGSAVGNTMLITSGIALGIGIIAILLYVTFRFEFAFALGAIVALVHDLIVTAGITTLLGQEMTLITVGAFLTIAGYSINDTIVVFDRVREGLSTKRGGVKDVMNYCLNATLSRTLLTSLTTLITVLVLFIFGGPGLRNFALTLIVGVVVGTYSSIFIASPIVLWWARRSGTNLRREVLDTEQARIDPVSTGG